MVDIKERDERSKCEVGDVDVHTWWLSFAAYYLFPIMHVTAYCIYIKTIKNKIILSSPRIPLIS